MDIKAMIENMVKVANTLDNMGLYEESDKVDRIIKEAGGLAKGLAGWAGRNAAWALPAGVAGAVGLSALRNKSEFENSIKKLKEQIATGNVPSEIEAQLKAGKTPEEIVKEEFGRDF